MRLLITRPQPDADASATKLRAAGHEPVIHPLIEPEFLPLIGEHDPVALVLTSRNGVRALVRWPEAEAWTTKPLFVVGDATAATAREAGFGHVHSADGDAPALARLIAEQLAPEAGALLYIAAEERSPGLVDRLAAVGYRIDIVEAYRMVGAEALGDDLAAEIASGAIEGALFYSRRSAARFLELLDRAGLGAKLATWSVFVLSPQIAELFKDRAVGRIEVAGTPREDALLQRVPLPR